MSKKGFTLIEILVVVAIIGILASMVIVGLGGARGKSRDARRISDLKQIQTALELYYTARSQYPNSNCWVGTVSCLTETLTGGGIGVSRIPTDPLNGHAQYHYGVSQDYQKYVLKAILEYDNPALRDSLSADPTGNQINCAPADKAYCTGL